MEMDIWRDLMETGVRIPIPKASVMLHVGLSSL